MPRCILGDGEYSRNIVNIPFCVLLIGRSGGCQRAHFCLHQEIFNFLKFFSVIFPSYLQECANCSATNLVCDRRRQLERCYEKEFVRSSVRLDVFLELDHQVFLNFDIVFEILMELCVTRPDFFLKKFLSQIWEKWAKNSFFLIY